MVGGQEKLRGSIRPQHADRRRIARADEARVVITHHRVPSGGAAAIRNDDSIRISGRAP
jgi:hypothetical protein